MAVCEVCGARIGLANQAYLAVPGMDSYVNVCKDCEENIEILKSDSPAVLGQKGAVEYVKPLLSKGHMGKETFAYVSSLVTKAQKDIDAKEQLAEEEAAHREEAVLNRAENIKNFRMTTGYQFDGYETTEYIKVVSGEVVMGGGIFKEIMAATSDTFGVRARGFETNLGNAKKDALDKARENAIVAGANALLGIDFDVSTIGNSMMVVSASGTAVHIEKV